MSSTPTPTEAPRPKHDIQQLVGNTLRWGVTIACIIAFIGGIMYLVHHGGEPMKDYRHFPIAEEAAHKDTYTTLHGILDGVRHMKAVGWIQLGVIVLILTPIMRVALSLFDFLQDHDWLYSVITAIVLAVIIFNSFAGIK